MSFSSGGRGLAAAAAARFWLLMPSATAMVVGRAVRARRPIIVSNFGGVRWRSGVGRGEGVRERGGDGM